MSDLADQQPARPKAAVFGDPAVLPHGEENLTPLAQLKRMQRTLYADVMSDDANRRERALSACAWEKLEERKRILTMRPKPRDVDVSKPGRRSRPRAEVLVPLSVAERHDQPAAESPKPPE